ncbi:MAG: hypothetical protein ACYC56_12740 [Candidatus Aquicultor sp.]
MAKPEETKRVYAMSDAEALELEKTIRGCFVLDKADFIAFDEKFNAPFETEWLDEITAAEEEARDNAIVSQQTALTAEVTKWMEESKKIFQASKYHIEKAFPTSKAVQNEFGYADYDKARQAQSKMIQFMNQFYKTAVKYSSQLIAKGFTQAKIDEIGSVKTALDGANQKQEAFKKDRGVLTQERVGKLNTAWQRMQEVCNAAKYVYPENYAKQTRYIISESKGTPPPAPDVPPAS